MAKIEKKIVLTWYDVGMKLERQEFDNAFEECNKNTFNRLVKQTEKMVEEKIWLNGNRRFYLEDSPYQRIEYYENGVLIKSWSIQSYMKNRRKR